jgi:hypothetical protein
VASDKADSEVVSRAFGAKNRNRLIDEYFQGVSADNIVPAAAWSHVYRLLLWADPTTGLAHCYESDKSQPGRNWYARSLSFHAWAADALAVEPAALAKVIDWLFRRATTDLAAEVMRRASRIADSAERQRAPYGNRNFPKPGEDPELISIVREVLGDHLGSEPTPDEWQTLVQRVRQYLSLENKRKNLVGEGFEDVLTHVIRRACQERGIEVHTRRLLHDVPGFNRARQGEKPNKVDVAVLRPQMRTLVTAKWSVRADREKQFTTDFSDYVQAESDGRPFEYVFVTNEFDPARLMRACEKLAVNAPMFTHVVHISTDGLKAAYGDSDESSIRSVLRYIENGRLISLERWLNKLSAVG